jgi:hypothetical protein
MRDGLKEEEDVMDNDNIDEIKKKVDICGFQHMVLK